MASHAVAEIHTDAQNSAWERVDDRGRDGLQKCSKLAGNGRAWMVSPIPTKASTAMAKARAWGTLKPEIKSS